MAYNHWEHCSTVALCNVGIEGGRTAYCRVVGQYRGCVFGIEGGRTTYCGVVGQYRGCVFGMHT